MLGGRYPGRYCSGTEFGGGIVRSVERVSVVRASGTDEGDVMIVSN